MTKDDTHEYLLNNGFKLIVREDHRSPIAIFQIFYKVGSSYESNGNTGLSHLLEHMMFRGTHKYSADKFMEAIAECGGQQNAYTGHDYTTYFQIIPAAKIAQSFAFEADRMHNLLLHENDFRKELEIVLEERRKVIEDDPQRRAFERFCAIAHLSSPYHNPIIGWFDDIKNLKLRDLRHWYKAWYTPNNAVGVVIGDVKPDTIYLSAKRYFGSFKNSTLQDIKPQRELVSLGRRSVDINIPAKLPWLVVGYNAPVLNTATNKWEPYALSVLCELLAGSNSARLPQKLIKDKQIAVEVNYHYSPIKKFDSALAFLVTPALNHSSEEVRDEIFSEIKRLKNRQPQHKELERIKVQTLANKIYQKDSIAYQAQEIGSFESIGLSWKEIDKAYKVIESIQPEQIQTVACKYLIEDNLTLAYLNPLAFANKK